MNSIEKKNYALPIAMMFALFAMISFVTGLQNPMGVIVKEQFGLSNFTSQFGYFANFIAYAVMGFPAGILLQKKGYKTTALMAIIVGFIGVMIQFFSGFFDNFYICFPIYLSGCLVAGFSMCMLNAVVNPMLNTLGGGGKKGNQLIQFGGSCNSIAATIVPVLVGYLMANATRPQISDANPALFIAMGVFAVVFIVLFSMNIPEPHMTKEVKSTEKDKYSVFSFRHYVLGSIAIFIYVGVEVGVQSILNLFMTSSIAEGGLAIDQTIAGSVVGTYWFLMLVGRLIGASVGSVFSSKTMLSFVSVLGLIFVAIGIFSPTTSTVSMPVFRSDISFGLAEVPMGVMFFVLCGLCTSVMWGGIFNLAVEGLGKYTTKASGFFMVMVCGGGILPLIQGTVADFAGFPASYWVIFLGFAYTLYYALIGSKNVNKDIPTE